MPPTLDSTSNDAAPAIQAAVAAAAAPAAPQPVAVTNEFVLTSSILSPAQIYQKVGAWQFAWMAGRQQGEKAVLAWWGQLGWAQAAE